MYCYILKTIKKIIVLNKQLNTNVFFLAKHTKKVFCMTESFMRVIYNIETILYSTLIKFHLFDHYREWTKNKYRDADKFQGSFNNATMATVF